MKQEEFSEKNLQNTDKKKNDRWKRLLRSEALIALVGMCLCLPIAVLSRIAGSYVGYFSALSIAFSMGGCAHILNYTKGRKKVFLVVGIGFSLIALAYFILYILSLFE